MKKFAFMLATLLLLSLPGALRAEDNSAAAQDTGLETATFAGGCFWCIQPPYDKLEGVVKTTVGYTGGPEKNPTYKQVSYGKTGHAESIEIIYDPKKVTYEELLDVFWMNIDPTDSGGQFVDRGKQYRPAIFYHGEAQKKAAEASRDKLSKSGRFDKPIVVEIVEAAEFYPAEDYHQMFYKKDPFRYKSYRSGSGRDQFIEVYWGEAALSH
jgi:methionine-S-sulfoxide reductase